MIEKAIAAALEPLADEVIALARRVEEIKLLPGEKGEPGRDADDVAIAQRLKMDPDFVVLLKGEPGHDGAPGQDGKDAVVDTAEVVERLKADPDFLEDIRGERGLPGEQGAPGRNAEPVEVDVDEVIKALKTDVAFVDVLRGEKGERGDRGEQGEPGRDADPVEVDIDDVVKALKRDTGFLTEVRGEKGDVGATGESGQDGADGLSGEDGEDGAGIDAPIYVAGDVYREGLIVQHNIGQYFRALCDTVAEPGESSDWQRVGTAGLRWRGLKPDIETLQLGDFFIDAGSLFLQGESKASMIVQRGQRGEKGEQGDKGLPGASGKDGVGIVALQFSSDGAVAILSDGSVMEAETRGLTEWITQLVHKALDESGALAYIKQMQDDIADGRRALKGYMGTFRPGHPYKAGDLVNHGSKLHLCTKDSMADHLTATHWTAIADGKGTVN